VKTLASFRNIHSCEKIVVCGCGVSLNQFKNPGGFVTIGVNDVGRLFQPTYLVVCNWERDFKADRWDFILNSRARYVFTQLPKLEIPHMNLIKLRHGLRNGTDFSDPNVLHYTNTSIYMALCLAVHMGSRLIGIIGVDYTPDHFFGRTGLYTGGKAEIVDQEFMRLGQAVLASGAKIFNLSTVSLLKAFPKMPLKEFAAMPLFPLQRERDPPLRIVSYSVTPVAGVAATLSRCINARTHHYSRCVWASGKYVNGIVHRGDIEWPESPAASEAELRTADIVIVHNGKTDSRHLPLFANKPVLTMAHNYISNVDQRFLQQGFLGVVVGQYQATLPEFASWPIVPLPVPIWEEEYQPLRKDQDVVTICYAPSSKEGTSPRGKSHFWHLKGYEATMRILDKLAERYSLRLEVIRERHVSHSEAMSMKRRSHIVIDECVTGSYHTSSLEGLAAGCVVINGVGQLPGVPEMIRECTRRAAWNPFVFANLNTLENVLSSLIRRGPEELDELGSSNRQWIERYWDFARQWEYFWMPVIERTMHKRGGFG